MSGPIAAIAELVKNGFDADAEEVVVKFSTGFDHRIARIEVIDSGHGMESSVIFDKWMEPATEFKSDTRSSPRGRRMLGSKGIGRFAAARLGTRLFLASSSAIIDKPGFVETTFVRLNWADFDQGKYLDEVAVHSRTIQHKSNRLGTTIRVSGIRDDWRESQFLALVKELRKFISPISANDLVPFSIRLDLSAASKHALGDDLWEISKDPNSESHSIEIRPIPILDAADYEVVGEFDSQGNFEGRMFFKGIAPGAEQRISFVSAINEPLLKFQWVPGRIELF